MLGERYRFIGFDGSMGLRRGNVYRLHVFHDVQGHVFVERRFLGLTFWRCPYSNFGTFYSNWESA